MVSLAESLGLVRCYTTANCKLTSDSLHRLGKTKGQLAIVNCSVR